MADSEWNNVCHESDACALTGAVAFFAAIPDAAIVVNGPLWCASYARRYLEMQCPSVIKRFFCTQADNEAVVYGTESCLSETLMSLKKQCRPGIILIVNNCSIGLIGDDLEGIAREVGLPCPVVCLDGGGLAGGFRDGYLSAAQACLERLGLEKRRTIRPHSVNFLGCSIGYYNERNDVDELRRMLSLCGVRTLNVLGLEGKASSLRTLAQASLNVVIHSELGEDIARWLQDQYDMPYVVLLPPYGVSDSVAWAETILHRLGDSPKKGLGALASEAEVCKAEVAASIADLERIWNHLWFLRAVIAAPPSVAIGVARALRYEWADIGHLTIIEHGGSFTGQNSELAELWLNGKTCGEAAMAALGQLSEGLLLGGNGERICLQQRRVKPACCQNIAMPVYDEMIFPGRPFTGLRGNYHLLSRLWNESIENKKMQ